MRRAKRARQSDEHADRETRDRDEEIAHDRLIPQNG
jgi:hypothetical protein